MGAYPGEAERRESGAGRVRRTPREEGMMLSISKLRGTPVLVAFGLSLLAAACSSGSSSPSPTVPVPTPAPAPPPPPPAPPPPPQPPDFSTLEFLAQPGLTQINALPAYDAGADGSGALIAIIDTGIDVDNEEFAGRLHPASQDLVRPGVVTDTSLLRPGGPNLQDVEGHGTAVAGIAAGARNDLAAHGVAPEAEILAFRANDETDLLQILGEPLVEGLILARDNDADVINLSLGSDEPGARTDFQGLLAFNAGNDIVTVLAAGNEDEDDPNESALAAVDPDAAGTALIVGAVGPSGLLAPFTNRAGAGAAAYVVAPGVAVPTTALGGSGPTNIVLFSGTSASTPHVSGLVALIRGRWPTLSAAEVVDIILDSAVDLGDPGVDPIYGHGLIDAGAAIEPLGSTTLTTVSGSTFSLAGATIAASPAFGDSLSAFGDFVFLDGYGRDFHGDLGGFAFSTGWRDLNLANTIYDRAETVGSAERYAPFAYAQYRLRERDLSRVSPQAAVRANFLDADTAELATRAELDAALVMNLGPQSAVSISRGFASGRNLLDGEAGADADFMTCESAGNPYLCGQTSTFSFSLRQDVSSRNALSVGFVRSETDDLSVGLGGLEGAETLAASVRFGRGAGARRFGVEAGIISEEGALLGARFSDAFGAGVSANTTYASLNGAIGLSPGTSFYGRASIGHTQTAGARGAGLISEIGDLTTSSFAFGVTRKGVWGEGDQLSIGVAQPLRVEAGQLELVAPIAFDARAGDFGFAQRNVSLAPSGRELDLEASYQVALDWDWRVSANAVRQVNADHVSGRVRNYVLLRADRGF